MNAALSAVSEDMSVFESPEHLIEFTPISEITEDHLISDASEVKEKHTILRWSSIKIENAIALLRINFQILVSN